MHVQLPENSLTFSSCPWWKMTSPLSHLPSQKLEPGEDGSLGMSAFCAGIRTEFKLQHPRNNLGLASDAHNPKTGE